MNLSSIANKISIIIAVALIGAFVSFSAINYISSKNNTIELGNKAKKDVIDTASLFIDEYLSGKFNYINTMAKEIVSREELLKDENLMSEYLYSVAQYSGLDLINIAYRDDGRMIQAERDKGYKTRYKRRIKDDDFDPRAMNWFKAAISEGKMGFIPPFVGKVVKILAIPIYVPIIVNNEAKAVINAKIYMETFIKRINSIKTSKTGSTIVLDPKKEKIISHPNPKFIEEMTPELKSVLQFFNKSFKEKNGAAFTYEFQGDTRIAVCDKNKLTNWLVCTSNSMSDYDELLGKILIEQVIYSIIFIVVIIALLLFIIKSNLKSIETIKYSLSKFFSFLNHETKEPEIINIKSNDEFGQMSKMINQNIEKVKQNLSQEQSLIEDVKQFAKEIESGNFTANVESKTSNQALEELKHALLAVGSTLEHKICKNANELVDVLESYSNKDFTIKTQDNATIAKNINHLGDEISNMLKHSLSQGELLQEKSNTLNELVNSLSKGAKEQSKAVDEANRAVEYMSTSM